MIQLDGIVRDSLHAQVQDPPAMIAPADRAIAGVRRVRRRRRLVAACAGVAVLTVTAHPVAGGGVAALRHLSPGVPSVSPATQSRDPAPGQSPGSIVAEVLTDSIDPTNLAVTGWRSLVTVDGRRIPLTGIQAQAHGAVQTRDGWLVLAWKGDLDSVWLLRPDGSTHRLIESENVYIAPGGRRFAWSGGGRLYVGHLDGVAVAVDHSTPAPANAAIHAYTGTAVILGDAEGGPDIKHHDVWIPDDGDYVPSWNDARHVVLVLSPTPTGLLGLVRVGKAGKNVCLAELDPRAGLRIKRTACGPPINLAVVGSSSASRDGRWLALRTGTEDNPQITLLDLHRVFTSPGVAASWDIEGPAEWLDTNNLVFRDKADQPVAVGPDRPTHTPVTGAGLAPGEKFSVVIELAG